MGVLSPTTVRHRTRADEAYPVPKESVPKEAEPAGTTEDERQQTQTMTTVLLSGTVLLLVVGGVASRIASSFSAVAAAAPTVPYGLQLLLELVAVLYLIDLITGLVHMNFDYKPIQNRELARHYEKDIPAVKRFKENNPLFLEATHEDKFLWNFQIHHDITYPAADSNFELWMQIAVPGSVVPIGLFIAQYIGFEVPGYMMRLGLAIVLIGPISQFTHVWAHARNRNLISSPVYRFLQDWHLVLNHEVHKRHHEEFDCNFALLNGWSNPLLNRLAKFLRAKGMLIDEPPTITVRRERDALKPKKMAADVLQAPAAAAS